MYIVDINEKFMSKAVQTVKWPQQQNIFYYFVALNQISLIYISVLHILSSTLPGYNWNCSEPSCSQ